MPSTLAFRRALFLALAVIVCGQGSLASAQDFDPAGRLAAALASESRIAQRLDGLIEETSKYPKLWSGSKNADSAPLRKDLVRKAVMGMRPQIVAALRERLSSTFSDEELASYLEALSTGPAKKASEHPVAYAADFAFTDVMFNAMAVASARAQDEVDRQGR